MAQVTNSYAISYDRYWNDHSKRRFPATYSISQEICTRFCCALLCCGYAIVHNDSHEVFIHIHQGCFAGTGAIVRLPQCQWSKPDGYGKISQCITTTKHSKAKTVCIFLGIYCMILAMQDTEIDYSTRRFPATYAITMLGNDKKCKHSFTCMSLHITSAHQTVLPVLSPLT